jgi:hypothetical protein
MARWTLLIATMLAAIGCSGKNNDGNTNPIAQGVAGTSGALPAGSGSAGTQPAAISDTSSTSGARSVAGASGASSGVGGVAGAPVSAAGSGGSGGTPQASAGSGGLSGSAGTSASSAGGGGGGSVNPLPNAGFPAVSDTSVKGPFTAVTISNTGPSGAYTVFHPKELAPNGALNPVLSWGNGAVTTPVDYPLLPHLASHGFVVVAANDSAVTAAEVKAGLDWIVERNADASSPFYQKLDLKRIGGVGYSLGGLATLSNADDPRYVTLVIISGASMNDSTRMMTVPKLHTPVAYLCTADDASQGNCAGDYAVVTVPVFFGVMNGSAHTDVTSFLGLGVPAIMTRLAAATTAWLRWQLMDDTSQKSMFVGADCGLCKDSNWTVKPQKNLN